jgi:FkbM family methyltransferase
MLVGHCLRVQLHSSKGAKVFARVTSGVGVGPRLVTLARPISFRGKVRLATRLTPMRGRVLTKVFGAEIELDLSNFLDRMIYMGCYEPLNTYRFKKLLRPGMVVVDVGANIGYFTLLAASLVGPSGRVFAVEPWPANFVVLDRCITRNSLAQVRAFEFGLAEEAGVARIGQADQTVFNNRTASMVGPGQMPVEVRTLDDCVAEWGVERIDLLKMDVDGYELKILRGAQRCLRDRVIRNLVIELDAFWLGKANSSTAAVISSLGALGFRDLSPSQRLSAFLLGPVGDRLFTLT